MKYWHEFLKEINEEKLVINIDEAGFGRTCKEWYSWLPKGKPGTIINDAFKGRVNLILGISQRGDYIGLITKKNVSSEDYWLFLTILARVQRYKEVDIENKVIIIQD